MSDEPMTRRGYAKLQEELKTLTVTERPAVIKAIEEARAHGDLSENAEYSAAREKQGFIEGRIRVLQNALARARVIDPSSLSGSKVTFGATVVVEDQESGEEQSFTLVGEHEAEGGESGLISVKAPLARALIGREEGDVVLARAPGGERHYEIIEIKFE